MHSGFHITIGVPTKSEVAYGKVTPHNIIIGDFGLPSLLLSDSGRNPDCNAER